MRAAIAAALAAAIAASACAEAAPSDNLTCSGAVALAESGQYDSAVRVLTRLVSRGQACAQYNLGILTANGMGTPADADKALSLLRRAARQGYTPAYMELFEHLFNAIKPASEESSEALMWLDEATDHGVSEAFAQKGWMQETGSGLPKDEKAAAENYREAALRGHAVAAYNLARCLWWGIGTKRNAVEAADLLRSAAVDIPEGRLLLSKIIESGAPVASQPNEVMSLLAQAAAGGVPMAQFELGTRLASKPQTRVEGLAWLKAASESNDTLMRLFAINAFGTIEAGLETPQATTESLAEGALEGDLMSRYRLGLRLAMGEGAVPNPELAAALLAGCGDAAETLRRELLMRMSASAQDRSSTLLAQLATSEGLAQTLSAYHRATPRRAKPAEPAPAAEKPSEQPIEPVQAIAAADGPAVQPGGIGEPPSTAPSPDQAGQPGSADMDSPLPQDDELAELVQEAIALAFDCASTADF